LSGSAPSVEESAASLFGFGRCYRLLAAKEYAEVFSTRRVLRGPRFVLHYRPNGLSRARLGLVIPKKQARAAVLRNAIKRQARELFRHRHESLPPLDLILRLAQPADRPRRSIDSSARAAWRAEITALFDELNRRTAR
jgi:ribonuclease P protein component